MFYTRLKKIEREQIDAAIENALQVVPFIMDGDFQKAMRELHSTQK